MFGRQIVYESSGVLPSRACDRPIPESVPATAISLPSPPLRHRATPRLRSNSPYTSGTVSTHPASHSEPEHLELPVEELLRRARPLPDHDEMAIEDLSEEEGEAFLAAVQS